MFAICMSYSIHRKILLNIVEGAKITEWERRNELADVFSPELALIVSQEKIKRR